MEQPPKDPQTSRLWRLSGMGAELSGSIIGMGLLGWLLDRWLGTHPCWTIVFAAIGMIGGGYNFIRSALRVNEQAARDYRQGHKHPAKQPQDDAATLPPLTDRDHEDVRKRVESFKAELRKLTDSTEPGERSDPSDNRP